MQHSEPALLVGDTGTGKTTVCQMLTLMRGQKLHIINCNQHTETSDFLGGFRPVRSVCMTVLLLSLLATSADAWCSCTGLLHHFLFLACKRHYYCLFSAWQQQRMLAGLAPFCRECFQRHVDPNYCSKHRLSHSTRGIHTAKTLAAQHSATMLTDPFQTFNPKLKP